MKPLLLLAAIVLAPCMSCLLNADERPFVRVSPRDARYFELSDGTPYIPVGLNMIAPPGDDLSGMEDWFRKLSVNQGNFVRIWLGRGFFEVEHGRSGIYDEAKAKRIEGLLDLARKYNIRLKLCLESFRHLGEGSQAWAAQPLHLIENGGTATRTSDFFDGEASRRLFQRKLDWYAARFGDDPIVFGWELWNEVDCIREGNWKAWTEVMLPELHQRFPKNLAMQSLGSFDTESKRQRYQDFCPIPGNDVLQVHRYLDLGAQLEVCRGPVDIAAADAVHVLLETGINKPVLLAESGAVEPSHSGPFKLYSQDTAGIILHDVLFAPFFSGAAGPGHIWHWNIYVDQNDLWRHFARFAAVVQDLDPAAEGFQPQMLDHPRLRVYVLRGRTTTLLWCRDAQNTWQTELADGVPPEKLADVKLDLSNLATGRMVDVYDPWRDEWSQVVARGTEITLPEFSRSIAIRLHAKLSE